MRWLLSPCVLVMLFAIAGAALAGDADDWSGWYGGIFGGYVDGKLTASDEGHLETINEVDDNSPTFGVQLGVMKQSPSGWVYGGELLVPLYLQKGTAEDFEYFPDENPPVIYEAHHKWSVLAGGRLGKAMGRWLPSVFAAVGFAHGEGKTLNVDESDVYSPGFEQSASATHMVYQAGGGADCMVNDRVFLGVRLLVFNSDQQKYEMAWNRGEDDDFGMHSFLVQAHVGRRF